MEACSGFPPVSSSRQAVSFGRKVLGQEKGATNLSRRRGGSKTRTATRGLPGACGKGQV